MAPQKNSTLIEEEVLGCSAPRIQNQFQIQDHEEALLGRCSPILPTEPLKNLSMLQNCNREGRHKHVMAHFPYPPLQAYMSQKCSQYYQKGSCKNHGRGRRSISLHGAKTLAEASKEIAIWIGNEPRYVSGITEKTTCKDIIKALIDDEIRCNNTNSHSAKQPQYYHENHKDGGDSVGATLRDYGDYVLVECWCGIEHSCDGNMAILPIWKTWSHIPSELRLTLRHRNLVRTSLPKQRQKTIRGIIKDFVKKLVCFSPKDDKSKNEFEKTKQKLATFNKQENNKTDDCFSGILPDKLYENNKFLEEGSSWKDHHKKQTLTKAKLVKTDKSNSDVNWPRWCNTPRNKIHYCLAQTTSEINELYQREHMLIQKLRKKFQLYRQQNQIYSNPKYPWDISIDQVQRKIERYALDIVKTEYELSELKNQIRKDISLINNLKLMSKGDSRNSHTQSQQDHPYTHYSYAIKPDNQMIFDHIHEFYDNNASILI